MDNTPKLYGVLVTPEKEIPVYDTVELRAENVALRTENEQLQDKINLLTNHATLVYATSKNTVSVRDGFEVGGYAKYYIVPPFAMPDVLPATENR